MGPVPTRYRKSFKVGGVRVNLNKKSVSVSSGGKGMRYTVNSRGRRTTTVSAPGKGFSYSASHGGRSGTRAANPRQTRAAGSGASRPAAPRKPGMFAPKAEKALYAALQSSLADEGPDSWMPQFDLAAAKPRYAFAAHALAGLTASRLGTDWALNHLLAAHRETADPTTDRFLTRYGIAAGMQLKFTGGITQDVPLSRELIGLVLAGMLSNRGDIQGAFDVVDSLRETPATRLELAELALQTGQPQRAVELTDNVTNTDDLAVATLAVRATALRQLGHLDAAFETTKEGLRYPSRARGARHQVRIARANTLLALGKRPAARKEADRVLAEDSTAEGLAELLQELSAPCD